MTSTAAATVNREESFTVFRSAFSFLSRGLESYVERERELRVKNGGKHHGPLQHVTLLLGVDDLLDDEWKRVLALGLLVTILAFFGALLGSIVVGDGTSTISTTTPKEEEEEEEYTWTPQAAANSMDGGNDVFLHDLLERIKPKWLVSNFSQAESKLRDPLHVYRSLPEGHWARQHRFRFPVSLNALLLGSLSPSEMLPLLEVEPVELSVPLAVRMCRLLELSAAQSERDLGLVKRNLLLGHSEAYFYFYDVVLDKYVCVCRRRRPVSRDDVTAAEAAAASIVADIIAMRVLGGDKPVVVGQGMGANVAVAVARMLGSHDGDGVALECIAFGPVVGGGALEDDGEDGGALTVTCFVHGDDQDARSNDDDDDELFLRLLVKLDECAADFTFADRLRCVRASRPLLPPAVRATLLQELDDVHRKAAEDDAAAATTAHDWYWYASREQGLVRLLPHAAASLSRGGGRFPRFISRTWFNAATSAAASLFTQRYREMFVEDEEE